MSSDMHDLLSRMADELDNYRQLLTDDRREVHALATEARAALAAAPEGEVEELVAWLRLNGDSFAAGRRHAHDLTFQSFHRAADLLEQLAAAAPAVVPDGPAVPEGREPASVAPEATGQPRPLSSAAQAVLDAFRAVPDLRDCPSLAAALRAVADQVVPHEQPQPRRGMRPGGTGAISPYEGAEDQRAATRRKLLGIAAELEGADG